MHKRYESDCVDNASDLYNVYLEICFDQHLTLPDTEKRKFVNKYDPN